MFKKENLIIVILTIIGFILRIYRLDFQSLWIDESFSINAALAVLSKGYPLLESGFWYSGSLLHTYLISFFMLIFSNDLFGARLVSVIFGTLTIPLSYYFGKEFFDKKIGLFLSILITFSVWEIAWSRQARMYAQLQFFFLLSLLFFYRYIRTKDNKNLYLTLISTFLTVLSHGLGYTLFLIYIIYFLFNLKEIDLKLLKNKYIVLILLLILLWGVMILKNYEFIKIIYLSQYFFYLKSVHFVFFYLAVIGALLSLKNFKPSFLLILSFLIPFFFISYLVFLIHYRYLYFILPILFLLSIITVDYVSQMIYKRFNMVISLILIALLMFNGFIFIPKAEYDLEKFTPQPNFDKTYGFVKNNLDNKTIIDAYPSLADFYLGKIDYGLKFSLTGREIDIKNESFDIYKNVPFIDLGKLKSLNNCYLIVDNLAISRINPELRTFITNDMKLVEEGSDVKNQWSGVKLYECKRL